MPILVTIIIHKSMEGMDVMLDFKIDKLGYYKNKTGNIIKVVHIDSKVIEYDVSNLGEVIGIDIKNRELSAYDLFGVCKTYYPDNLVEYLGDTPIFLLDSVGYYKNRAGNTVRVIHICDKDSPSSPVFVIDEGTGKFYTTNIYGKSDSTENLDLVEFVSR
jgi:hypothetical protein